MSYIVNNQIELSATFIGAILLSYALGVPGASKFIELAGYSPAATADAVAAASHALPAGSPPVAPLTDPLYRNHWDDFYFVLFGILGFTLIRASIMTYVLQPLAAWNGLKNKFKIDRFCEQLWLVIFYASSWTAGLLLMSELPHWFDTQQYWIDYPHIYMTGRFKRYYLWSMAFWLQQFFVLQVEEQRKDYWQMLCHHVITCALIISSYFTHFTRVGNAVLCVMDFADIFLCSAKVLRYIGFQTLCDFMFGLFVLVWIVTRHILFGVIVYSTYADSRRIIHGAFDPPSEYYYSDHMQYFFLFLFALLQIIIIFWFVLIIRVISRVVSGQEAADNRSSDESDADERPATSATAIPAKKRE